MHARLIGLITLIVLLGFSIVPTVHAQAEQTATWNFRQTLTVGNMTAPMQITYGFEIRNGSITTTFWDGQGWGLYTLATFQVLESQTLVVNSSSWSFDANMTIACPAPYVTGFINIVGGGGISITQLCSNNQIVWGSETLSQWP